MRRTDRKFLNFLAFAVFFVLFFFFCKIEVSFAEGVNIESLRGKVGENPRYSIDKNTERLTFLSGAEGKIPLRTGDLKTLNPQGVCRKFFKVYGSYFGIRNPRKDLQAIEQREEGSGAVHVRYSQQHKGVKVFGGEIIVHLNSDYSVSSANGKLVPAVRVNIHPKISRGMAEEAARELWRSEFGTEEPETRGIELMILNKGIIENKKDKRDYLVWKIDLVNQKAFQHKIYFISARNGKKVHQLTASVSFSVKK